MDRIEEFINDLYKPAGKFQFRSLQELKDFVIEQGLSLSNGLEVAVCFLNNFSKILMTVLFKVFVI